MKYVNIVIDNKANSTDTQYTYICDDNRIKVGDKVKVLFAAGRTLRDGYVISTIDDDAGISDELKQKLRSVVEIDDDISLTEEMVRTAIWMKNKYLCRYIDAIKCFTPAGKPRKAKRAESEAADEGSDAALTGSKVEAKPLLKLTEEQQYATETINGSIAAGKHDRFLIHGVTGSGKTEIYIRATAECLRRGGGVIILVPEISLTGQITDRFLERFGENSVAVLHSKLTVRERHEQWNRIRNGNVKIVIGARSAVFAPLQKTGLVVIDEEHESTYKSDHTPKYDTIEVALKRVQDRDNKGVLLLGSATPSVVSYSRAEEGIYKLITLKKRYNEVAMPHAEIVDMRSEMKEGNRLPISRRLAKSMEVQLSEGKQVILFLNRRGYATFVSCRECGYVAKCPNCGLSLTYHRSKKNTAVGKMLCHYCGHEEESPALCPECGSSFVRYFGSGTEKIEEVIQNLFPDNSAIRVDLDSIKKKGELNRLLKAFAKGKADILIGTQLIAKGLDFKNVGLVGVISADVSLNIPDFRSSERAFQLITQAAGRAGRGDKAGEVIIQTYNPEHYAILTAAGNNYERFYEIENGFRRGMAYPPYSDLFRIVFTSDNPEDAAKGAEKWHGELRKLMGEKEAQNLFPPQEAYMSKIRDTYRYSLVIKCPKGKRSEYTEIISRVREEEIKRSKKKKNNYIAVVDVNPYSFS